MKSTNEAVLNEAEVAEAKKAESKKIAPTGVSIVIPQIDLSVLSLTLEGISPLICHRFGTKARAMMLAKQKGEAQQAKEKKDPQKDFEESLYIENGKYVFPVTAFKKAAISACTSLGKTVLSKTLASQSHHVLGTWTEIHGSKPVMREDIVRLQRTTADIRFRGEFHEWSVQVKILFNKRVITKDQIVNLYNLAGFAVGVGEWRPEKSGQSGMFKVVRASEEKFVPAAE